jgi:hypothetical protein
MCGNELGGDVPEQHTPTPSPQDAEVNTANGEDDQPENGDAPIPRKVFGSGEDLSVLREETAQLMKDGLLEYGKTQQPTEPQPNGKREGDREGFIFKTSDGTQSAKRLREYIGFRPVEVFWRTLECTTQLARRQTSGNLRRHVKTRFPGLNHKRIHVTVATDTAFSNKKDILGPVLSGMESHHIDVYGIRTESDGEQALSVMDFTAM